MTDMQFHIPMGCGGSRRPYAARGDARRVGKVAKVVYAYRGPKVMDSMSRWLGHTLSRCGLSTSSRSRRETPSHRVRKRGA
jgi:hypothetical protein